jgi:hypothetical protein
MVMTIKNVQACGGVRMRIVRRGVAFIRFKEWIRGAYLYRFLLRALSEVGVEHILHPRKPKGEKRDELEPDVFTTDDNAQSCASPSKGLSKG